MATVIEIAPDGTRTERRYDPHNDGPITSLLALRNQSRRLNIMSRRYPRNKALARKAARIAAKVARIEIGAAVRQRISNGPVIARDQRPVGVLRSHESRTQAR